MTRAGLRALRGIALAAGVASAAGCGTALDLAAEGDRAASANDEHARRSFVRKLDEVNEERAVSGLLPLDECSQCYWKHARWAAHIPGCPERVRRWEFGDYTALDPPGTALAATVPIVSDSVQRMYDERAENDRFLHSDDLNDSRDYYSRRSFRQSLLLANARRLQDGLLPLDLCSQAYWKERRWAMKVDGCGPRVLRYEAGESTALEPAVSSMAAAEASDPDSVRIPRGPEWDAPRWKSFSWRAGARAQCGTFAITELTALRRFESPTPEERYYLSFDAGAAHNVADRVSIGGSLFAAGDNSDRAQYGIRARFRYWLGKRASVDVAPGVILLGQEEENADLVTPAPIVRIGMNPTESFGLAYQIFETKRPSPYGETKERASYVGAQLGSTAGLAGTGFLLLVAAIGAILFIGAMASN